MSIKLGSYINGVLVIFVGAAIIANRYKKSIDKLELKKDENLPDAEDASDNRADRYQKRQQVINECRNIKMGFNDIAELEKIKKMYHLLNGDKLYNLTYYPSDVCIDKFECMKDAYPLCSSERIPDYDNICRDCWQYNLGEFPLKKGLTRDEQIEYIVKFNTENIYKDSFLGKRVTYRRKSKMNFSTIITMDLDESKYDESVETIITDLKFHPHGTVTARTATYDEFMIELMNAPSDSQYHAYDHRSGNIDFINIDVNGKRYSRLAVMKENGITQLEGKVEEMKPLKSRLDFIENWKHTLEQDGTHVWSI